MEKHMRGGPMGMNRPGKKGGPAMRGERGDRPEKDALGEGEKEPESDE